MNPETVRLMTPELPHAPLALLDPTPRWLPQVTSVLCFVVLTLDAATPLGIAVHMLYIIPVALTVRARESWVPPLVGALSIGLVILGYTLSPPGDVGSFSHINRSLSSMLILITVGLIHAFKQYQIQHRQIEMKEALLANTQVQIVESAPHGLVMINPLSVITLVNRKIERQFGYDRAELLGQSIEIILPEWHGVADVSHGRRKDGAEFPIEINLSPVITAEGARVLASIVNITERERAERQIQ